MPRRIICGEVEQVCEQIPLCHSRIAVTMVRKPVGSDGIRNTDRIVDCRGASQIGQGLHRGDAGGFSNIELEQASAYAKCMQPTQDPLAIRSTSASLVRWSALVGLALLAVVGHLWLPTALDAAPAESAGGMVATVHPLATKAAVRVLRQGGNAVDAAVAAGLTLGVVDTANSGIGGGCLMLIRRADGQLLAVDGRETAPALASRDMFVIEGKAERKLSLEGPLAVGVPGAIAAYAAAVQRCGNLKLSQLLQPGIELAERGFPIDRPFAERLEREAEKLRQFAGTRDILFSPDGTPLREGDRLKQADLANTYRAIAQHGPDWFYRRDFARQVAAWMRTHRGLLAEADFASYQAKWREPVVSTYRNYEIIGFPPPSSGGIHVAQILNILEPFDLREIHRADPAAGVHLIAAAMERAFADRAYWLGDSDYCNVPRGLIDKSYAEGLSQSIDLAKATEVPGHGLPPDWQTNHFGRHTTHVAAADADGNWVALTQTINTSFGSGIIVPGTGVVLNNEMDDFSIQPGTPNTFGLVGGDANAIAAGKRPLSSMSPTIVLQDGHPMMTVGAAGGPTIISQVVLALVRCLDYDMALDQAVAAPRFHHQWRPQQLFVEEALANGVVKRLEAMGHTITARSSIGVTQAILQPDAQGPFIGVHDPRIPGLAAGP
jgi:gamma-glutamyltranspeptidase/glutathione hydrolase